jgi:hypothetical protein
MSCGNVTGRGVAALRPRGPTGACSAPADPPDDPRHREAPRHRRWRDAVVSCTCAGDWKRFQYASESFAAWQRNSCSAFVQHAGDDSFTKNRKCRSIDRAPGERLTSEKTELQPSSPKVHAAVPRIESASTTPAPVLPPKRALLHTPPGSSEQPGSWRRGQAPGLAARQSRKATQLAATAGPLLSQVSVRDSRRAQRVQSTRLPPQQRPS